MRKARLLTAAAAALLVAAAVPVFDTAGAVAEPAAEPPPNLGTLTVDPETGSDQVAIKVTTSGGCSADSDAYNVMVTGPGKFADGYLITTTQDSGFSTTDPFTIFFGQIMRDAATDLGTTLVAGDYPIEARCVDSFFQDVKGTFTATLTFTSPTEYHATATTPPTTTTTTTTTGGSSTTTTTSSGETTTEDTTTDDTTTTDDLATDTTGGDIPTDTATGDTPTGLAQTGAPVGWFFVAGLFLVVLGSIYVLASQRRARRQ